MRAGCGLCRDVPALQVQQRFGAHTAIGWSFQLVAMLHLAVRLGLQLACAAGLADCRSLLGCSGPAALLAGAGPLLLALAPLAYGLWVSLSSYAIVRREGRADADASIAWVERVRAPALVLPAVLTRQCTAAWGTW